jgi:hypothetical protein
MGFLDSVLGRGKRSAAPAKRDRLFALTTAYITLETSLSITTRGVAAIVFQPLATADFATVTKDVQEIVSATGGETGTTVETTEDTFGYRWMVLRDDEIEDLVVGVNAVRDALAEGGYADRVLCAVFAFQEQAGGPDGATARPLYLIYNEKRGTWYPFIPAGGAQQRDSEAELRLRAQLGDELPLEQDVDRWLALWGIPI